jgi:subtilisin family serine protease
MFSQLWGLKNNYDPSYDINVCEAWSITKGDGIKVAILDLGVDLTHPDLVNNLLHGFEVVIKKNERKMKVSGNILMRKAVIYIDVGIIL